MPYRVNLRHDANRRTKVCRKCERRLRVSSFSNSSQRHKLWICMPCNSAIMKSYYRKHCERIKAMTKAYRQKYVSKTKKIAREGLLKRVYGITIEQYDRLYRSQRGRCAICKGRSKRRLDVDHCHNRGHVRGLLCSNCNRMLGMSKDSPETLRAAAVYLTASRKTVLRLLA